MPTIKNIHILSGQSADYSYTLDLADAPVGYELVATYTPDSLIHEHGVSVMTAVHNPPVAGDSSLKCCVFAKKISNLDPNLPDLLLGFRGTANLANILRDDLEIGLNKISQDAENFVRNVNFAVQRDFPNRTQHAAGHSLGASLATLYALISNTTATVFDTPGNINLAFGNRFTANDFARIEAIQSAPNWINLHNQDPINVILQLNDLSDPFRENIVDMSAYRGVEPDLSTGMIVAKAGSSFFQTHSMKRILDEMKTLKTQQEHPLRADAQHLEKVSAEQLAIKALLAANFFTPTTTPNTNFISPQVLSVSANGLSFFSPVSPNSGVTTPTGVVSSGNRSSSSSNNRSSSGGGSDNSSYDSRYRSDRSSSCEAAIDRCRSNGDFLYSSRSDYGDRTDISCVRSDGGGGFNYNYSGSCSDRSSNSSSGGGSRDCVIS